MPFSSDGDTIDFIYGVINWKNVGETRRSQMRCRHSRPSDRAMPRSRSRRSAAMRSDRRTDEADRRDEPAGHGAADAPSPATLRRSTSRGRTARSTKTRCVPELALDDDAGLADRLWAARETAEAVKAGEGRTRAALYRALVAGL